MLAKCLTETSVPLLHCWLLSPSRSPRRCLPSRGFRALYRRRDVRILSFTPNRLEDNYTKDGGTTLSATSVTTCLSKRRHVPEDSTVHGHRCGHLRSHTSVICFGSEVGALKLWHRKFHKVPAKRRIWWTSCGDSCIALLGFPLLLFCKFFLKKKYSSNLNP